MSKKDILNEIIEYEGESVYVDFKKEYYHKEDKLEKIKDVISMANAHTNEESRYIIFGVKILENDNKEFKSVVLDDPANIEELIQSNVEPDINLKLYIHKYKEFNLGILEIYNCNNRPYIVKKDSSRVKSGTILIRSGTTTRPILRSDLDRIYKEKKNLFKPKNIKFGFNPQESKLLNVLKIETNFEKLPSTESKKHYEDKLELLQQYLTKEDNLEEPESLKKAIITSSFFGEFQKEKIRTGYGQFNFPVYRSEIELKEKIKNIKEDYFEQDMYYIQENIAQELNFYIFNSGTEYLNDVLIELVIPKKIGHLFSERVHEPQSSISNIGMNVPTYYTGYNVYPEVSIEDSNYIVRESFGKLRHQTGEEVFSEPLKIVYKKSSIEQSISIKCTIHAKELEYPIQETLKIEISEK